MKVIRGIKTTTASRLLKLPPKVIHRYARLGILPAVKVGREWRFFWPDILWRLPGLISWPFEIEELLCCDSGKVIGTVSEAEILKLAKKP